MVKISSFFHSVLINWYYPDAGWLQRWLERLWIPALYLIGLFQWGTLVSWGNIPLDMADWADITAPRLLVLQDAVRHNTLPLHILAINGMKGITDRFLAVPDIILSPQILLLKFVSPSVFLLINLLLLYTIGFIGLEIIRRKYRLSLAVFSLLFFLFMFNGHIVDHIFIGHATWMSYFLMPFFILLVFSLFEKQPGWKWINQAAWLMVIVFLQGGFHFFVFMLVFIFLLGILTPHFMKVCLIADAFAVLISAVRILPVSLVSSDFQLGFLGGFTTLNEFLNGLVMLIEPSKVAENISRLNPYVAWWEFDYYIGWIGLILIALIFNLSWRNRIAILHQYRGIFAPAVIMTILSIGRIYKFVFLLGIPMLTGERVGSRFLVLPFLFAIVIATIAAQRLLECYKIRQQVLLLFLGAFLLLFNDLAQHMELWSVTHLKDMTLPAPFDPSPWVVANRLDPSYQMMLIVGALLSVMGLIVLTVIRLYRKHTDPWLNPQPPRLENE